MPRNPNARPCSSPGCKSYAVRDSDPPLCSAHAGRNKGAGAPKGNQNRRTHGIYSTQLSPEDLADLVTAADDKTIDDEIAIVRLSLRRCLKALNAADDDNPLSAQDLARLTAVVIAASKAVARLLRDSQALSGQAADGIAGGLAAILDDIATQWGLTPK